MAYQPNSNSVVAFQSQPSSLLVGASVIGLTPVATTPSSVLVLNPMVSPSVIAYQAAGSVLAISGTFSSTPQGSITAIQAGGSVQAVRTDNASVIAILSNSSVAVLQGTSPWIVNVPTPSYISYQAAGSIMAVSATVNTGNSSVQVLGGTAVIGSVATLQGTTPWIITPNNNSIITVPGTATWITSLVSTVPSSVVVGASVQGTVPVTQVTSPWVINMPSPSVIANQAGGSILAVNFPSPSIIAYQLAGSILATSATVNTGNSSVQVLGGVAVIGSVAVLQGTNPWVIGNSSVTAIQGGTWGASITGTVSVLGTVPVTQSTTPWIVGSILGTYQERNAVTPSVFGIPLLYKIDETNSVLSAVSPQSPFPVKGSITAIQGTNPWNIGPTSVQILGPGSASIGSWNVGGAVSIVGAPIAADNSAWAEGNIGMYTLAVRNDNLTSISAASGRYSPFAVGPVGETIIANAPITQWVQAIGSVFNVGPSIQVLAAGGTSVFNYITGIQITNASANNVYVTFTGGLGGISSVLGYAPIPANGGAIIEYPNGLKTGANSGFSASVSGTASVFFAVQGFISKT